MKGNLKDPEKIIWDRTPNSQTRILPKLMVWLLLFVTASYVFYTLKLLSTTQSCNDASHPFSTTTRLHDAPPGDKTTLLSLATLAANESDAAALPRREIEEEEKKPELTDLKHVVFGIAASAKLWEQRKNYIKIWYKSDKMRGVVWMDDEVATTEEDDDLPPVRISGDTSKFAYKNRQGHRSAIRISRIVSETLRLGTMDDARWFVMGDDDTVFVAENLVRILRKYDHTQYYYIGSLSESHIQNIYFSYGMAYGGGGFAISYPLAKALEKMQDRCIQRYPGLYGSDDRMQACMAELGVPLTKEIGFHQGIMQQSICYDKSRSWTVSVSWGFAVQIFRGVFSPREVEMPSRTFLNWYKRADYTAYAFNTRPVSRNPCQKPFVFYLSKARFIGSLNTTVSEYQRHRVPHPQCRWKMANPSDINMAVVYKRPDPTLWNRVSDIVISYLASFLIDIFWHFSDSLSDVYVVFLVGQSPRRNCCRVMNAKKKGTITIDVGMCRDGEVSEI
ncbi:hypothetical protein LINPERHAP1_LOCUS14335 [Linum perenne]